MPRGCVVSLRQCFELGRLWYEHRLDFDWKPKTAATMRTLFQRVGLDGAFWDIG
jgi:hypothetical protein